MSKIKDCESNFLKHKYEMKISTRNYDIRSTYHKTKIFIFIGIIIVMIINSLLIQNIKIMALIVEQLGLHHKKTIGLHIESCITRIWINH